MTKNVTEKWHDGTDMKCEVCEGPILKGQPRYRSRTQQVKKRSARHSTCTPDARSMSVGGKTYEEWAVEAIQLFINAEALLFRYRFDAIRCIVNKDGHWFQSFKDGDSAAEAWQEELSAMADSQ